MESGIAATTYDWGKVRLSMPLRPLKAIEISMLKTALSQTALSPGCSRPAPMVDEPFMSLVASS